MDKGFKVIEVWKQQAAYQGYRIVLGTSLDGDVEKLWRAYDKQGNGRGSFDLKMGKGELE